MNKNLYQKAFTTNEEDPDYLTLSTLRYEENGRERELPIPKGDILFQFRKDVDTGKLPTISWLVPPQNFSDHPSAPWYGAWYTSEVLDILTKNPEVWKKTIFILTYDENDGYFDHVPPFTPPHPTDAGTGKCSESVKVNGEEFVRREQELKEGVSQKEARSGPIGLGFRVPMIIASPWSRGGKVCSQVFDHTSVLQFVEEFLNKKFAKKIKQETISDWRRTVCGNLTSAFSLYDEEKTEKLPFLSKKPFIEKIYSAKFKNEPSGFKKLSPDEIAMINHDPFSSSLMARQETGIRPSRPLPYQLYADGKLSADKKSFEVAMRSANEIFDKQSAGSPFTIYAPGKYLLPGKNESPENFESARSWQYAVAAGDFLTDAWPLSSFENGNYHLCIYGPNGFFRKFTGDKNDPLLQIDCDYQRGRLFKNNLSGNVELKIKNTSASQSYPLEIIDQSYGNQPIHKIIDPSGEETIVLDLKRSFGWYDFMVRIKGSTVFSKRFAGKVETGKESFSDPAMGKIKI